MSSFRGLSIGISGIFAQQRALDVTGHNISNVNTVGYTRQVVNHSGSTPVNLGYTRGGTTLQLGTGVDVQMIKQYRDEFLDQKLRKGLNELGYWGKRQTGIEELETIFNDNSEEGLQSVMNDFWDSWSQVSKPAGGLTARALVKESAIAFVETVKYLDQTLTNYRNNKDVDIRENVNNLNQITKRIAELNKGIRQQEATGATANDYRDERSELINELASMVKVRVIEDGNSFSIAIEGKLAVEDSRYTEIEVYDDPAFDGYGSLRWADTKGSITLTGGGIKAMFETRDEFVKGYRDRLDEFVKGFAAEANKIHESGRGIKDDIQRSLFKNVATGDSTNINLANIIFNSDLNDLDNIAAGKGTPGSPADNEDNRNANEMLLLRNKKLFSQAKYEDTAPANQKNTFDEYYRLLISDLGINGQEAQTAAAAQVTLVSQINNRRTELSGVSLDEEMANMIKYEKSYNACARVVNAMDEMIDYIVNKIGIVGR